MLNKMTVDDINVKGKRGLVRCDFMYLCRMDKLRMIYV